eukprot:3762262-Amphidinium_carterae.1
MMRPLPTQGGNAHSAFWTCLKAYLKSQLPNELLSLCHMPLLRTDIYGHKWGLLSAGSLYA